MHSIRFAFRQLIKRPGFMAIAVLIVAIGIGASTTMFSTVNALVLRPVAFPESDRLAVVYETNLSRNVQFFSNSYWNYVDWRSRSQSWESLAGLGYNARTLTGNGEPEFVSVALVSANFFSTLRIKPVLGRDFLPDEDRAGGQKVAVVSESFWKRRMGAKADVLSKALILDGKPYTIIGVLGNQPALPSEMEIMVPMQDELATEGRMHRELEVYGRLKAGVTMEQADAEMKTLAAQISSEHPDLDKGWSTRLVTMAQDRVGTDVRKGVWVALGAVGVLLLIACANLSNLLLTRASARSHELAVRSALGAGRWTLMKQLLGESLLICSVGGLLGVLVSVWTIDLLKSTELPRAHEISLDGRVIAVAVGITLLSGLLAGVGPAFKSSQSNPQLALKGRAPNLGRSSRLRDGMVVAQIGLSLMLLVAASLLARSFWQLLQVRPGFVADHVLTLSMRPSGDAVPFYEQLTARVAALPEVKAAGLVNGLPLTTGNTSLDIFPGGKTLLANGQSIQASWRLIDGGYFSAMQIPVLRGRTFAGMSPDEAKRSIVLSASLARAFWGDEDPIGRQVDPGGHGRFSTVIGVVGDVRGQNLGTEAAPTFYWSYHRFIYGPMHLAVKTTGAIEPLVNAVRNTVKSIDPTVPIFRVRTMERIRETSLDQQRLMLGLLLSFAGVSLFLATLGVFGVISFSVEQRTSEIGVRMALGAQVNDIVSLVLKQGLRLVLFGLIIGVVAAVFVVRVIESMLYSTNAHDLVSYGVAIFALLAAGLIAILIPARRAAKLDPVVALRAE